MKNISLVLSNTYICKGKVYEAKVNYEVADSMADHLLKQRNERGLRYFRLVSPASTSTPMHAGNKSGNQTRAADAEPEVVVESVVGAVSDEETDPDNPQLINKAASTGSLEDADEQVKAPVATDEEDGAISLVEDIDDDPIVLDADADPEVDDDVDGESEV